MIKNCQHCGQVIRIEGETGIWVHNNGFATCLAPRKLGDVDATFAEPTQ
jgi:hypothetical protein